MRSRPAPATSLDRLAAPPEPEPPERHSGGVDRDIGDGWGVTGVPTWISERFGEEEAEDDLEPRRRIAVAPPAAIALILVGVIAVVIAGLSVLRGDSESTAPVAFPPSAGPTTPGQPSAGQPGTEPSTRPAQASELVVSVVGLVHKPGLVRLPEQARVADALDRAGGAREGADLLSLNMAQRLNDGDQILVGYAGGGGRAALRSAIVGASGAPARDPGSGTPGSAGPASAGGGASSTVNLNTATEAQLDALPGVGPVTAKAIIAWRDQHGKFGSVDQLGEVDGIGPARLARLRPLVSV